MKSLLICLFIFINVSFANEDEVSEFFTIENVDIIETTIEVQKPIKEKVKIESRVTNDLVSNVSSIYYQIGSYKNTPSEKYLNSIKSHDLNYKVTQELNSFKLLLGPYKENLSLKEKEEIKSKLRIKSLFRKKI